MDIPKAVIFGCAGTSLAAEEKTFFAAHNPVGFILFARNCESPEQVKRLTDEFRAVTERQDVLILIDQEGGRVARLKPPYWRKTPAAGVFAELASHDLLMAKEATYLNARLIAQELHALGINVDCAPLADIPAPGSHDIIGDRAFGREPEQVGALGREMARGLLDGGVLPVLKHIPGHGRAASDSHESLPEVTEPLGVLRQSDFVPFKTLRDLPLGMTAHIRYTAIDSEVATLSPKAISLIRHEIGFDGLLMSDDLSMKALSGSLADLAQKTLAAGCDLVLHCNGKMEEMQPIAEATPVLNKEGRRRLTWALLQLKEPAPLETARAEVRLQALLAG